MKIIIDVIQANESYSTNRHGGETLIMCQKLSVLKELTFAEGRLEIGFVLEKCRGERKNFFMCWCTNLSEKLFCM